MSTVPKIIALAFAASLFGGEAFAQGGDIIVAPSDPEGVNGPPGVGIGVSHPGQPGLPGQVGGTNGATGHSGDPQAPACTSTPIGDPNNSTWNSCSGSASGTVAGPVTPVAGPTPAQLAEQAYQQMRMPLPVPQHSPDLQLLDGRSATLVGEHTWIWTDRGSWITQSKRVAAGPVWAEVTAAPVRLSFETPISTSVSCPGPGTPYDREYGLHAASPDCDSVFTRSSYGEPGDQITATYSITWSVSWTGSTGSGTLPNLTSRATTTFAVAEAQALIH